ncbi:MAG: acetamidase/formamidase family protein [Cyanobacteria bacterium J06581_3]
MAWTRSRRWVYALIGAWAAVMLSVGSLLSDYEKVFAAGHTEHVLPATADTVHWGYFSQTLEPKLVVDSGDTITVETLTHHANDDAERMVTGDPGAESVFAWSEDAKGVDRRGAGPMDAEVGAGAGYGVHILTGPIYVNEAEPGDVLEVQITGVAPRPSANPEYEGKTFGSNAAAWWGYHYNDLIEEPNPREVITIYEVDSTGEQDWAEAVYNYRWVPQTDPYGVVHETIDYPGVPVDHDTIEKDFEILEGVRVPIRPHFGTIGLAVDDADLINSIPPSYFGGNIDNWRIGTGATMYYPVAVEGGLLSLGDPHAAQGDSELAGTAIETSLTGDIKVVVHKQADLEGTILEDLDYPLLETDDEYVVHGFSYTDYLAELGENAQADIFANSSVDGAMRDAFRKMRHFLMTTQDLSEDEAISLMSVAVDFGITQVVDGNWGVHGAISKAVLPDA